VSAAATPRACARCMNEAQSSAVSTGPDMYDEECSVCRRACVHCTCTGHCMYVCSGGACTAVSRGHTRVFYEAFRAAAGELAPVQHAHKVQLSFGEKSAVNHA
jgi:hypothetical protein